MSKELLGSVAIISTLPARVTRFSHKPLFSNALIFLDKDALRFFEDAQGAVFTHGMPGKIAAIHSYIDARTQSLDESQCSPQIKHPIGTAEGIRNHCTGQHDRLVGEGLAKNRGGLVHSVGSVSDDDARVRTVGASFQDQRAMRVGHLQAVDH